MSCLAVVLVVVNNSRPDLRDYKQECVRFWGPTLYFQVHGTAMGTRMAPSYAQLERRFLDNTNVKLLIWRRYIDVIFTIWCRGEASLECFLGDLNTTTKFKRSILFLDTGNGQLITDLHANQRTLTSTLLPSVATNTTAKKPSLSARLCKCAASVQPMMISGSGLLS